ncbi:ThiF family adenylyltransferase [Photorhabdus heterorhabditis]|uniref:ThiF family adenylyltransferase n=1 Tax=Photorhabdus heterorhabditis TaxID=880156 RepID=A0A5B0X2V5_9GAMM|nr:ThiF family adenylyltransferase [Photorhabdus heterorhabditis]KAA1193552.1 ThiF family adenylyltransferase [Photorhabdus heterorhabditis]
MIYKLNASVIIKNNSLLLHGKNSYELKIQEKSEKIISFIEFSSKGIDEEHIKKLVSKDNLIKKIYNKLKDTKLIISYLDDYKETSMEKSHEFLNYHLSTIEAPFKFKKDLHALIIGCGGIGSHIAICLATSGFSEITLIDYDKVDITNLNRQFAFDKYDIGEFKVTALKNKLKKINSELKINIHIKKLDSEESLDFFSKKVDIIISAIDTPVIMSSIYTAEYALKHNIPIIYGAVGYDIVSAGPLLDNTSSIENYISSISEYKKIKATTIKGSIASTNSLLASILANSIISYFYPFAPVELLNKRKVLNPTSLELIGEQYYDCH